MEVNEIITNEEDIKAGMEVAKACISNGFKKGFGINAYLPAAAREIIKHIKCENDISPLDSIELFKGKMLNFNNIHKRSIFDVGYETANDIIDLLMA